MVIVCSSKLIAAFREVFLFLAGLEL